MRSIERMFGPVDGSVEAMTMQTAAQTARMTSTAGVRMPSTAGVRMPITAGERGGVRLTRRGRVLVVLSILVMLVVGFSMGRVSSQAADSAGVTGPRTVTVQPGESLWALATRIAPHVDPRLVVTQIEQLNHLRTAELMAGQQLRVPLAR
jgi:hypothetical protein